MKENITITGHRGAAGLAPENTLAAMRIGMQYADRIEIDVHQSRDGELVVIHDASVNRTTNGKGKVKNLNYTDIAKLDAGTWFSEKFRGERVPLLEEAIDLVCPEKILLIELKEGAYPQFEERVVKLIERKQAKDRIIIQSFSTKILERVHKLDPAIRLHKLFVRNLSLFGKNILITTKLHFFPFQKYPYIEEFSIFHRFIFPSFIRKLDEKTGGKMLNVWVENNPQRAKKLIAYGIDGIITDFPDRIKKALNE